MSEKSLYLDGRPAPIDVRLVENALSIRTRSKAEILCPLGRVDRVSCWGEVTWTAEALAACAAQGVLVGLHRGAAMVAFIAPAMAPARPFAAVLELAARQPAFPRRVEDWARHEASRAQIEADRRAPPQPGRPAQGLARIARRVDALYAAWLSRRLPERGVPVAFLGPSSARAPLPKIFGAARAPDLLPLKRRLSDFVCRRPHHGSADAALWRRVAIGFEAEIPALAKRFDQAWRRFEILVRDLAEGDGLWDG